MSKASEWEKQLEGYKEDNRPTLRDSEDEDNVLATVDDYGQLEIERATRWTNTNALCLARWILDTFSDEKGRA